MMQRLDGLQPELLDAVDERLLNNASACRQSLLQDAASMISDVLKPDVQEVRQFETLPGQASLTKWPSDWLNTSTSLVVS